MIIILYLAEGNETNIAIHLTFCCTTVGLSASLADKIALCFITKGGTESGNRLHGMFLYNFEEENDTEVTA